MSDDVRLEVQKIVDVIGNKSKALNVKVMGRCTLTLCLFLIPHPILHYLENVISLFFIQRILHHIL